MVQGRAARPDGPLQPQVPQGYLTHWVSILPKGHTEQEGTGKNAVS